MSEDIIVLPSLRTDVRQEQVVHLEQGVRLGQMFVRNRLYIEDRRSPGWPITFRGGSI